jgi:hypothetical protein
LTQILPQGDQIGRIFAGVGRLFYFGLLTENCRPSPNVCATFPT